MVMQLRPFEHCLQERAVFEQHGWLFVVRLAQGKRELLEIHATREHPERGHDDVRHEGGDDLSKGRRR